MDQNNTACSPFGNCTIILGTVTNGTYFVAQYDPNAPVPEKWHQDLELATICIFNSLSLLVIIARIWYRHRQKKRFRGDDKCMAVAAFFLIGYWASQIGTNVTGSGLHMINVTEYMREMHWHFEFGWAGYYIVTSCIKMSICFSFLQILPEHFRGLRIGVYCLCAMILSVMFTNCFGWWFECQPFLSNFIWTDLSTSCINYDIFRWLWVAVSVPIDIVLTIIPLQILKRAKLREHERRILKLIFCATLLGTLTCCLGIYGVWADRIAAANDWFYQETAFIMMNVIEIFMYTLGASFPVLSRYLVQRASPSPSDLHNNFSSWARYIPNFFPSTNSATNNLVLDELQTPRSKEPSFMTGGTGDRSSMPSTRANSDAMVGVSGVPMKLDMELGERDGVKLADFLREVPEGEVDLERGEGGNWKQEQENKGLKDFTKDKGVVGEGS